ncbi:MAG: hypothetical protein Q8P89_02690 [bacterium]|nr:hypothetical protein [bacterium]
MNLQNQTLNSLASLAMDLKRASLGFSRGSNLMAQKFLEEAIRRKQEISPDQIDSYIKKILAKLPDIFGGKDDSKKAEDALMYGVLLQNYVVTHSSPQRRL